MTNPLRSSWFLALALIVALFAAGCSGSTEAEDPGSDAGDDAGDSGDQSGGDDASDDEPGDPADDSADDVGEGEPDDGADDDAGDDATDDNGDDDGDDMVALDGDVALYCQLNRENQNRSDSFTSFADPVAVEAWMQESRASLAAAIPIAPTTIRADLETIAAGLDEFIAVVAAAGWDVFSVSTEIDAITSTSEYVDAEMRLDAFEADYCGGAEENSVNADDAYTSPEVFQAALASPEGRALIIAGMTEGGQFTVVQAECLLDNLDFDTLFALGAGLEEPPPEMIAALFTAFAICDIDPSAL